MSTPRRPLPPEIYMRRRVAALVIILVLVIGLIVAWSALRGGDGGDAAPVAQTAAPAATSAPASDAVAVTSEAAPASEGSPAASESAESAAPEVSGTPGEGTSAAAPSEGAEKKTTCELADLQISVNTDQPTYAAGTQPRFVMTILNDTAADCTVDLDANQLRFEVYAMATNDPVWTDTDCTPSVQTGTLALKPGESRQYDAVWSRMTSTRGACEPREQAPVGAYFVHAVIGTNHSNSLDFRLL